MNADQTPIEYKVETRENAPTLKVDLTEEVKNINQGLEAVPVPLATAEMRRGYNITFKVCVRCGTDAADTDKEKTAECSWCKGKQFRVVDRMYGDKVSDIINRQVMYKCQECSSLYKTPTICCLGNYAAADQNKELKEAWRCTACQTVYYRKPKSPCCTFGRMMYGKAFKATYEEYLALPKVYLPLADDLTLTM